MVRKLFPYFKSAFLVTLGTVLLAFGTAVFILPQNIVAGGVSGLSLAVHPLLPKDSVSIEGLIAVFAWGLFFVGFIDLGISFALKTLLSTLVYPPAVALFGMLLHTEGFGDYFFASGSGYSDAIVILAATVGGAIVGLGVALAFISGSSTGGTDIIAFVLCKHFPRLRLPTVTFTVDALIVILAAFVMRDIVLSLLGVVSAFVCSAVIDRIMLFGSRALVANVVTSDFKKINREIIDQLGRTATVYEALGGYSGEKRFVISVSMTSREYAEFRRIIERIDPSAFITVYRAHEIRGEGWK